MIDNKMNEHNIALLRQIIIRRKEMYDFFVKQFGKDYPLTKDILQSVNKLEQLLAIVESKYKI